MKDLNKSTFGSYLLSYFCMKIDALTYGENMTDREISLFIHEYIHYLQSFTTIYGLERINSELSVLANLVDWLRISANSRVTIPLLEDVLNTVVRNNALISNLVWGDTDDISHLHIVKVDSDYFQIDEQRQVESISLSYRNENGLDGTCTFGAREIYEGMAYMIEQFITKDYEESPDHPYCTAIKVANFIYPQLLDDRRNILVLCDKALMSSNPGAEYVNILRWLKQVHFLPSTPDELFYFLDYNWETFDLNEKAGVLDTFINRIEFVRSNLHSLLQDERFADYHKWLDVIFDYAIDLRKTEPMFWLDIVDNGYVKDNLYFHAILYFAGSPLIETVKHEYFTVDPEGSDSETMPFLKVFHQIYKVLVEGKTQCELMPWCNNSPNVVRIDETCYKCPWKHKEANGELCPFKSIWQHWGLDDVEIMK